MSSRSQLRSAMRPPTPSEMEHPSIRRRAWAGEMGQDAGTGEGPTPVTGRADAFLAQERARAGQMVYDQGEGVGPTPITGRAQNYLLRERVNSGDMAYDYGTGAGPTPIVGSAQQWIGDRAAERAARQQQVGEAYQYGQGYLNNPFDAKGRGRIGRQFWEAPLGGHLRSALAGQEVFGHTITGGQARVAEQAAAGLLATGVGVPMFLEAVRGLTTPQSQGTIPMG